MIWNDTTNCLDTSYRGSSKDALEKHGIGSIIDGKYELISGIGYNSYFAISKHGNHVWEVKILKLPEQTIANAKTSFERMMSLSHPGILTVEDVIQESDTLIVVRDCIQGITLDQYLENHESFSEEEVVSFTNQLCDALTYLFTLEEPIVLGYLEPRNIIINPDGTFQLYLDDSIFDTCKLWPRGYTAPECYLGHHLDPRRDIYSLGVIMHQMLTGQDPSKPPYEIRPIRMYNPDLSAELEYVIEKCTQLMVGRRYQNYKELAKDLNPSFRPYKKTGFFRRFILNLKYQRIKKKHANYMK